VDRIGEDGLLFDFFGRDGLAPKGVGYNVSRIPVLSGQSPWQEVNALPVPYGSLSYGTDVTTWLE